MKLLPDEQISPEIAIQIRAKRPDIAILSLYEWLDGTLISSSDRSVLLAASDDEQTLVTFDLQTIPLLLRDLAEEGITHAGIIFIDEDSIHSDDFGGIVRSLISKWDHSHTHDWHDRIDFLHRMR